jgi:hypothetical protein
MTTDIDTLEGESGAADFKSSFDPSSKQEWCELIKDIVAMANSGGGIIIVGVDDDGNSLANANIQPILAVDPADVTNRIHSYTDQHFAAFEIFQSVRRGNPVAVIEIGSSDIPIVFTAHGGYGVPGGQKTAFVKGSVYFRHGAKSEPGTTDDLRQALERRLSQVKGFWLDGIGKIMAAPAGSDVQIVQRAVKLEDSAEAMPVRLTTESGAATMGIASVALQDAPNAVAIRLTNDEGAPTLSVMQADKLYPHRLKELVAKLNLRIGGQNNVSTHDLLCVRRVHNIDEDPMFSYKAQFSPRKYTDACIDWLSGRFVEDSNFFKHARDVVRSTAISATKKE